jgi:hypothetical protein
MWVGDRVGVMMSNQLGIGYPCPPGPSRPPCIVYLPGFCLHFAPALIAHSFCQALLAVLALAGLALYTYNPFDRDFLVEEYTDPLAGLWDSDVVANSTGVQPFRLAVPDSILEEQQALMWVEIPFRGCADTNVETIGRCTLTFKP